MIRIPGEGSFTHSIKQENARSGNFLTKLFRQLIAKISSLFDGVFASKSAKEEEHPIALLANKKFELLNLKEDIKSQKAAHEQFVTHLQQNPEDKLGKEFLDYHEKLPVSVKKLFRKFMGLRMARGKTHLNITNKEVTPFFHELKRIGTGS